MVKRTSSLASNEVFRVRVLVGLLWSKLIDNQWCLWCSGARLAVNQKYGFDSRSDTLDWKFDEDWSELMNASVLQRPTLVLNRNWQPVNVATVARALVLLWNEAARVVDPADYQTFSWSDWSKLRPRDGEAFVQAVSMRLRVPEVVALTSYDRLPARP